MLRVDGCFDEQELIDELDYLVYKAQRLMNPGIEARRWGKIFPCWREYEMRYEHENRS